MKTKPVVLYAEAVAVLCPHCGEAQPDPEIGSQMWEPEQIKKRATEGPFKCVACDKGLRFGTTRRAFLEE